MVLEWFIRIVDVLERDAVELALVDVSDPVILAPLRTAARGLQVVLEAVRGKPATNKNKCSYCHRETMNRYDMYDACDFKI